MEEVNRESNKRKRERYDSEVDSEVDSERVDSGESRFDSGESGFDSPEAKRFRLDLLDILDDSDTVMDRDPASQDLDSVIKSLEEEIMHHSPPPQPAVVVDDAVPQPALGYLLEASDDELGLPPAISPEVQGTKNEAVVDVRTVSPARGFGFDEMVLEDEIPNYESFEWRIGEESREGNEFVALGGLFDYPDSFDFSDFPQPELSAL